MSDEPKFIVDNNVGKLAVWLRVLGYDTAFINPIDDADLVQLAELEGRHILTKDTGIFRRRTITQGKASAFYVPGNRWREQLGAVARQFKLDATNALTRCLVCNCPLQAVSLEQARGHVPEDVLTGTGGVISRCPCCGRFYWQGGHWKRMMQTIEAALPSAG